MKHDIQCCALSWAGLGDDGCPEGNRLGWRALKEARCVIETWRDRADAEK
jgi:hypothetical protein